MGSWERQKNILDFTLSALLRRKGKNLALILVYTLIVFVLASVLFLTHSLRREAIASGGCSLSRRPCHIAPGESKRCSRP
jgi:hypothetical protein